MIWNRALNLYYGNRDLFAWLYEIIHRQCIEEEEKGILWNAYRKQEKGRHFEERGKGNTGNRKGEVVKRSLIVLVTVTGPGR